MKIDTVYLLNNDEFSKAIANWTEGKRVEYVSTDKKGDALAEIIEGVVVFHENHNFSKEDEDIQALIESHNKPAHRVDINGTLAATASNFTMWLERNKPKSLLVLGNKEVSKNKNLMRFLNKLTD